MFYPSSKVCQNATIRPVNPGSQVNRLAGGPTWKKMLWLQPAVLLAMLNMEYIPCSRESRGLAPRRHIVINAFVSIFVSPSACILGLHL